MVTPILPNIALSQPAQAMDQASSQQDKDALKAVAADFEAAFIAQMLNHSGLADALTSNEGRMASAFGTFFIEQLAEEMTESGGIGLADSIYKQLERYEQGEI